MPLRIRVGYDEDDLHQAQWNLIQLLQNSCSSSWGYFQARQHLSEIVSNLGQPESPTAWVEAFSAALLRSITALSAARCEETEDAHGRGEKGMNVCVLSGIATVTYYDEILTRNGGKQPFLSFLLRIQGPRKEGDSTARIVVYGQTAKGIFPLLYDGKHVEIVGRFRNSRRHQGKQVYEFIASRVDFSQPFTKTVDIEESNA